MNAIKGSENWSLGLVVLDVLEVCKGSNIVGFNFIPRRFNQCAHNLA